MKSGTRESKIIRASWIAIIGNAFLSIIKIIVGIIAGSFAVIADGIDSASDVLTSLITLITAHIISKPPDPKYPYGYSKADTVATKVLAFIIFFAGAQLAISSFNRLISNETADIPRMRSKLLMPKPIKSTAKTLSEAPVRNVKRSHCTRP